MGSPVQCSPIRKGLGWVGQTSKKSDLKRRVTSAAFLGQPSSLVAAVARAWGTQPMYRYPGRLGGGGDGREGELGEARPMAPRRSECVCENAWAASRPVVASGV